MGLNYSSGIIENIILSVSINKNRARLVSAILKYWSNNVKSVDLWESIRNSLLDSTVTYETRF